jgi:hypothetical protein
MDDDRWIDDGAADADGDDADTAAGYDAAGAARFRRDVADVVFLVGKTETDSCAAKEEEDDDAAACGVLDDEDDNCLAASNLTRNCRSIRLVQSKTKSKFNQNMQKQCAGLAETQCFLSHTRANNFHFKQLYHMWGFFVVPDPRRRTCDRAHSPTASRH